MTPLTQSIIKDPNQIFQADTLALRNELKKTDEKTHEAFLNVISETEWMDELPLERKQSLFDKVMLVSPSCTIVSHKQLWMKFLASIRKDLTDEEFPFKDEYFRDNREHAIHYPIYHVPSKNSVSEGVKLLHFLKWCFDMRLMDPWEVIQSGIPLAATIQDRDEDLDLLDIAMRNSNNCEFLGKVIKLYQEKWSPVAYAERESSFKSRYLKSRSDTAALLSPLLKADFTVEDHKTMTLFSLIQFRQILPFLNSASVSFRRNQVAAHPLYYMMATAFLGNECQMEDLLMGEHKIPLSTYFRRRFPGRLTTLETGFILLNQPRTAQLLVKASGGKGVRVSESDRLFRTYDLEKRTNALLQAYEEILKSLTTPQKWTEKPFLRKTHLFMKMAFLNTVYILRDARDKSGGDLSKMRELLYKPNDGADNKPNFCEVFLNLYWFSRNHVFFHEGTLLQPNLTSQDEDPFFDPNDYRYQWRILYTFISALIRTEGIQEGVEAKDQFGSCWDLKRRIQVGGSTKIDLPAVLHPFTLAKISSL
jgi:hypothetical protein